MFIIKIVYLIKSFLKGTVLELPCAKNLNYFWNFGSFLGFVLVFQIFSGFILRYFYRNTRLVSFRRIEYLERLVLNGFIFRCFHMNLASLIFFILYLHIFRGLYFFSNRNRSPWGTGVTILLFFMATAFLGYVLPWGQISFWAATVITKFFRVIPFIGTIIVEWIWRGFSVNELTLKFFFSLHFLLPFILVVVIIIHLLAIHFFGSTNPSLFTQNETKINFTPFFIGKDLLNLGFIFFFVFIINLWISSESVNFIKADPSVSPAHIKPEWYFLFAYAILRSVPNKLLGVLLIGFALVFFYIISIPKSFFSIRNYFILNKVWFFLFFLNFVYLRWVGGNPVTDLFVVLGLFSSIIYFWFFIVYVMCLLLQKLSQM